MGYITEKRTIWHAFSSLMYYFTNVSLLVALELEAHLIYKDGGGDADI